MPVLSQAFLRSASTQYRRVPANFKPCFWHIFNIFVRRMHPTIPAAKGSIRTECRRTSSLEPGGANASLKSYKSCTGFLWTRQRAEFKLACLVQQSLAGQTPSYLASDIQLACRYWPPSTMCCSMYTQQLRRQKLFCCRPSSVERLAITSAAGHELQTFPACSEKTYV